MRPILSFSMALFAFLAAVPVEASAPTLDSLADKYVALAVQAARIEPDSFSVDHPSEAQALAAKAHPLDRAQIVAQLGALVRQIDSLKMPSDPLLAMRQRYLRAHAVSLAAQLEPDKLAALPVAEQVKIVYGFDPVFGDLESYDPAIAALEKALPGPGSLSDRIDAMKKRAQVPAEKIAAVVGSAVAECRHRASLHLKLPKEELAITYPADPLVPGQSTYLGGGKGRMAVSTVVPADVDRLLALSCHEAYPGHHTNYATLDEKLWSGRHWPEGKVSLGFEPQFAVSDAISEYGVGLNFPLDERMQFERDVLYPLAGLTMQDEAAWRAFISARSSVLGATSIVIRDYLDKKIDSDTAKTLSMRYRLMNPRSAEQLIKMVNAFGIDIIASDQGWLAVDRAFAGKPIDERWRLLQKMEEEPMLLGDVRALADVHN